MSEYNAPLTPERIAARMELCAKPCTLNGAPAVISGARKPFATVTDAKTRLTAEWSWEAVERIVKRGGRFQS